MPIHTVTLSVDGVIVVETITADTAEKAIKKAKDKHPVHVTSIVPLEDPSLFDGDVHPAQSTVDEQLASVADLFPAEDPDDDIDPTTCPHIHSIVRGDGTRYCGACGSELEAREGDAPDPVEEVSLDDLDPEGVES